MHPIDWTILFGTLIGITAYGIWKTRKTTNMQSYLVGDRELKWWTIGLSIMATQASAITFLSTTGQGYEDGMRFAQFYIGLPFAMVILSVFFLPIFYKLKVYTAYEYLEGRFDVRIRTLTAVLFLLSRGMAAGITIYAPAIVLSTILGWNLTITTFLLSVFVIFYTVWGGSKAVSVTQQQQMIVILSGMVVAFFVMFYQLPPEVNLLDTLNIAGHLGKVNLISFKFDWADRYNFWTGMLGGTFLFLSYFGTDQSQVQRYLSGETLEQSRLGLLFNGLLKVPMQVLVLSVGVMMFVFYQFNPSPIHFNQENLAKIQAQGLGNELKALEDKKQVVFDARQTELKNLLTGLHTDNEQQITAAKNQIKTFNEQEKDLKKSAKELVKKADPKADTKDSDYVFISFVVKHLPVGIIGLLLAVIFSAAMSSKASELNALATSSVIDIYKRQFVADASDEHYKTVSKYLTAIWGMVSLGFALIASRFENLIEAVNIIGSLFYGTILGIFVVAFFLKKIQSNAVLFGAIIAEIVVIAVFMADKLGYIQFAYLWLNFLGCLLVIAFAYLYHFSFPQKEKPQMTMK